MAKDTLYDVYSKLKEYIFSALLTKTNDLGLIALEKGKITERKAIDYLIDTMEQYTNYGFYKIEEKLNENPNYFYKNTGFLDMVLDLIRNTNEKNESQIIEDL
jgi:hypothetical protein